MIPNSYPIRFLCVIIASAALVCFAPEPATAVDTGQQFGSLVPMAVDMPAAGAGRELSYLNGYEFNGTAYFSAIWNDTGPTSAREMRLL